MRTTAWALLAAFTVAVRGDDSFFSNPPGQPPLPVISDTARTSAVVGLNLSNIQSDTLVGMKKKKETFLFFKINNNLTFRQRFAQKVVGFITDSRTVLNPATVPNVTVGIGFSQAGLLALNITDDMGDSDFSRGMVAAATELGDPGTKNWVPALAATGIHGVFLVASNNATVVAQRVSAILSALGTSVTEQYRLSGSVRPGSEEGHEPFGFLDGISQPAVSGFVKPLAGQTVVPPGQILLGNSGGFDSAPAWAKDGSFIAFRQLKQLVPEFSKFLTDNPLPVPGLTKAEQSALLGARMVGRWKSGAPVDLAPLRDNPTLGADATRNNNFTFSHSDPGFDINTNQTFCPFSAHIRKTHPRDDLGGTLIGQMIRAGIAFGPEVTASEASSGVTSTSVAERGLAFVSYQAVLGQGFTFVQETWANNLNFVHSGTGVDPLIGSSQRPNVPTAGQRVISGLDPTNFSRKITLVTDFIVSRGGEYFFTPPLSALRTKFAP